MWFMGSTFPFTVSWLDAADSLENNSMIVCLIRASWILSKNPTDAQKTTITIKITQKMGTECIHTSGLYSILQQIVNSWTKSCCEIHSSHSQQWIWPKLKMLSPLCAICGGMEVWMPQSNFVIFSNPKSFFHAAIVTEDSWDSNKKSAKSILEYKGCVFLWILLSNKRLVIHGTLILNSDG